MYLKQYAFLLRFSIQTYNNQWTLIFSSTVQPCFYTNHLAPTPEGSTEPVVDTHVFQLYTSAIIVDLALHDDNSIHVVLIL